VLAVFFAVDSTTCPNLPCQYTVENSLSTQHRRDKTLRTKSPKTRGRARIANSRFPFSPRKRPLRYSRSIEIRANRLRTAVLLPPPPPSSSKRSRNTIDNVKNGCTGYLVIYTSAAHETQLTRLIDNGLKLCIIIIIMERTRRGTKTDRRSHRLLYIYIYMYTRVICMPRSRTGVYYY